MKITGLVALWSVCTFAAVLPKPVHPVKKDNKYPSPVTKTVAVYTTAKDTKDRLSKTEVLTFKQHGQPLETEACIFVDPDRSFQTVLGIGGALTDASAETFYKIPKAKQQEILRAYYDKTDGIGYSLARTHIQSCDFSSGSYTYVADGDKALKTFNVDHDKKYRIPFIKEAIAAAGGKLTLVCYTLEPTGLDENE